MTTIAPTETLLDAHEVPAPKGGAISSTKVLHGRIVPPQQQVLLYSSAEWEEFIHEWVHFQKTKFRKVVRMSGANDMGIDVAGLCDAKGFKSVWDNFQCKHYDNALTPSDAVPEIGKMLWHSFNGEFVLPRTYYFVAPKECGMTLKKLLLDAAALKAKLFEKWDDWCANTITKKQTIALAGDFEKHVQACDFSRFTFKTLLEVIDEHRLTPYYAARFGGGLPDRAPVDVPPVEPGQNESRYLQQLFEAYAEHKKLPLATVGELAPWQDLVDHYNRQREFFYHAESLRNFARDTVPPGTFEDLQDEVHAGVIEVEASEYIDGYARLGAVSQAAAQLPLTASGLISVTRIQDKRGICHQLANVDRLRWKKP